MTQFLSNDSDTPRATRRRFLQGALSSSAVLLLAACAPSAPSSPTAAPAKPTSAPAVAGSPAASPAAKPAASPAAAAAAPKPIAKPADFPTKPLEIIVPFNPGGGYDAVARQLATPMQRDLGQPVVIKNVPGGGQRIAARQFQQSQPDGYTMIYPSDTPLFVETLVNPPEGFDLNAWIWVAGVRKSPAVVSVGKDSPYKTIHDVLAAEKSGTRIRIGHNGVGGFLPTQVAFVAPVGMKNITYVGGFTGTADIAPALIRGDIDLEVFSPISSTMQFVQSGDIRPLVCMEPQRNPLIPNVPTARELGLPNVEEMERAGGSTSGIAVPPRTPAERVAYLESIILTALADPEFQAWAKGSGVDTDLMPTPGREFSEIKKLEYQTWTRFESAMREAVG